MGCGCKKKNEEPEQSVQNQTESTAPVATPQLQQEQIIQVAVALREMIENKEL